MNTWAHTGTVNGNTDWGLATAFYLFFNTCSVCVLGFRDVFTIFDLFKTNFKHFSMSLNALSMYFK